MNGNSGNIVSDISISNHFFQNWLVKIGFIGAV